MTECPGCAGWRCDFQELMAENEKLKRALGIKIAGEK